MLALFALQESSPSFFERFLQILILLIVVAIVLARLPRVDLGEHKHTPAFRKRRVTNWLPIGLTYAFLYMGRYNLTVSKGVFEEMQGMDGSPLMANSVFSTVFMVGTIVYGVSFLINGPLTDKLGGRFAILLGAGGAAFVNVLMGLATWSLLVHGVAAEWIAKHFELLFCVLYGANMYFQSFGAVAIVKVNSAWFHIRERGVFGAIFGVLISLGVYFAFDINTIIRDSGTNGVMWVFFLPAIMLFGFTVLNWLHIRDTPGEAGMVDFHLGDASSNDTGERKPALEVFKLMMRNPVIVTIAGIEFCSGFMRQAIMQWYQTFAKQTDSVLGLRDSFVNRNWGMLLCCAGILGGVFAGTISDHFFKSRRGPVAAVLYGIMLLSAVYLMFGYETGHVGWIVVFMSMAVIGVHGMLSGTASMDFGGKQNVGVAVGIIDGFVYLGTAFMSLTYKYILPEDKLDPVTGALSGAATDPGNWWPWPAAMIPMCLIGFLLAMRVWHATAQTQAPSKR